MPPALHPYVATGYLTSVVTLATGFFVYSKNRQSPIHKSFLFFSISIWLWSFFTAIQGMQEGPAWALFWGRFCHIGAILIPVFFYYFTLKITGNFKKIPLTAGFVTAFLLIFGIFTTPWFIPRERTDMGVRYITEGGPLYFVVILFFSTYVLLALIHLWIEIRTSRGARKKHLQYFFLASVLGFGIGIFNFLPVYGITLFPYPYSAACGAIYSSVIAYAILRHKLFEIELMIKKGIVFGFLFGTVYLTVSGLIFLVGYFWTKAPAAILSAVSITMAMLLYEPLKRLLTRWTHRFLFQKKISYTALIHNLTNQLSSTHDSRALAEQIVDFLTQQMALEWVGLYLPADGNAGFRLTFAAAGPSLTELGPADPIIGFARAQRTPFVLSPFDGDEDLSPEVKARLRRDRVEAIVPIFVEKSLYGILLLGRKKSDDAFSGEDEALLQTLMDEAGMFFLSAKLLKEVTRSNLELGQHMKMAAVTQLAAGVHHEVRNPLQAIELSAQALLQELDQNPAPEASAREMDKHLAGILAKVERIQKSLERFAQFARPEEDFELTALDLRAELEKFFALMQEGQKLDKIRVHNRVPSEFSVWACEGPLQNIFFNLFTNAYEAMQGQGELFLDARNAGDFIEMKFRDRGPGISKDILPHIFDRYFTTKKNREAMGIGLSITRHHIQRLGGSIEASDTAGKGAEFILRFRKAVQEAKAA
ncbi:MAG: ATP-binding protein [Candidatus Omnitrophica bacterium]|nr:ATP-binding protein [Candidatus Omnitrophota bacterium]